MQNIVKGSCSFPRYKPCKIPLKLLQKSLHAAIHLHFKLCPFCRVYFMQNIVKGSCSFPRYKPCKIPLKLLQKSLHATINLHFKLCPFCRVYFLMQNIAKGSCSFPRYKPCKIPLKLLQKSLHAAIKFAFQIMSILSGIFYAKYSQWFLLIFKIETLQNTAQTSAKESTCSH